MKTNVVKIRENTKPIVKCLGIVLSFVNRKFSLTEQIKNDTNYFRISVAGRK